MEPLAEDKREKIKNMLRQCFDGKIVRKDLTKKIKEGANVPVYVLEFLLGQYCSSDDPEVIETGVENVKRILADNYVRPDEAQKILAHKIPGVFSQREFRRFYPQGPAMAHVLGFTNIDDRGQEGLELAFDEWLSGTPGVQKVIRDNRGRIVENVDLIRSAQPGKDLTLSIDRRIQYLAHRELRNALLEHQASSGSIVIMRSEEHTSELQSQR